MRAPRLLLVALIACGALVALAPASGAAVPAASKACNGYKQLQKDLKDAGATDAKSVGASEFKDAAAAFKKAAKSSPAKVKAALNTIASYYSALGGGDPSSLADIGKNGQKFSKAIGTFSAYVATACS